MPSRSSLFERFPGTWRDFIWETALCLGLVAATLPLAHGYLFALPFLRGLVGSHDSWALCLPGAFFLDHSLHQGTFPLWNPLVLCGHPFAANPQMAAFYPPHLLRAALSSGTTPLSSLVTLRLEGAFHVLLAFTGLFVLGRRHGLSIPGSALAGWVYAYATQTSTMMMGAWMPPVTSAWMPFLIMTLEHAMKARAAMAKMQWAIGGGLLLGLCILGGSPQTVIYAGILMVCCNGLLRGLDPKRPRGRVALRTYVTDAGVLAFIFVFAALLSAAVLVPAAELAREAMRGHGSGVDITYWQPPVRLLAAQLRVGAVLLACLAAAHPRRARGIMYLTLTGVFASLFVGGPYSLDALVRALAPYKLGSPNRTALVGAFPLGLAAGLGLDVLGQGYARRRAAVLTGTTGLALTGWYLLGDFAHQPSHGLYYALPALLCMAVICAPWLGTPRFWQTVILVGAVGEVLLWDAHGGLAMIKGWPAPCATRVLREAPHLALANRRTAQPDPNWHVLRLQDSMAGYEPAELVGVRRVLCGPHQAQQYRLGVMPDEVTEGSGYGNVFLKRLFWLAPAHVEGGLPPDQKLFPPTAAAFLATGTNLPLPRLTMEEVPSRSVSSATPRDLSAALPPQCEHRTTDTGLCVNLGAFPVGPLHAALVVECESEVEAIVKPQFWDLITGYSCMGRDCVVRPGGSARNRLEIPLPDASVLQTNLNVRFQGAQGRLRFTSASLWTDSADENPLIHITERTANEITVDVGPLDEPRALLFVNAAYPGWRAFVDGKRTTVHLANDAFMAVAVPAGTHRVRFEFRPTSVYLGTAISAITLLTGCTALAVSWLVRRTPRQAGAGGAG